MIYLFINLVFHLFAASSCLVWSCIHVQLFLSKSSNDNVIFLFKKQKLSQRNLYFSHTVPSFFLVAFTIINLCVITWNWFPGGDELLCSRQWGPRLCVLMESCLCFDPLAWLSASSPQWETYAPHCHPVKMMTRWWCRSLTDAKYKFCPTVTDDLYCHSTFLPLCVLTRRGEGGQMFKCRYKGEIVLGDWLRNKGNLKDKDGTLQGLFDFLSS